MIPAVLVYRFVVLIPHRDREKALGDYRRRLFAAGFEGAWSFPPVVPLGILSRPLDPGELKDLAVSIRGASLEGGRDGWFRTGAGEAEPLPLGESPHPGLVLYGPRLDPPLTVELPPSKLLHRFPHPLLVCTLARERGAGGPQGPFLDPGPPEQNRRPPQNPPWGFRAAALANLALRPLDSGARNLSFEWRIGRPLWLSPVKSAKKEKKV